MLAPPVLMPEGQELRGMIVSAFDDAKRKRVRTELLADLVGMPVSQKQFTSVSSGSVVVEQGTPWPYFSVVVAGELQVTRSNGSAGEKVIGQLTPGNWFGNLKRQQAPATLTATKDCLLAVFFLFEEKVVLAAEG